MGKGPDNEVIRDDFRRPEDGLKDPERLAKFPRTLELRLLNRTPRQPSTRIESTTAPSDGKGEGSPRQVRGNMKAFVEFASKAQNEMDHFVLSLETNPSKILLINAIIMFDELLRNGLTRGFGYRKRKLPYKFGVLLSTAEVRFGNQFNFEHWQLLRNLSEMRNHVAHRKSSNIPFGAIIPNVVKHRFHEEILQTNFMEMLIPELYDLWKQLITLVYTLIYANVMARVELSESEAFANDAKAIFDYFIELINSPEGKDIRKQLDEIMRQPS